jgi:DNA (cytosine-5)-methyltransferase 1
LQGFTDEDYQKAKDCGLSNSQLYKQAGNSICVPVVQGILKNLLKVEDKEK